MIGRLRGEVLERSAASLIVDVGGVGYVVQVSAQCPYGAGQQVDLHIHTAVREDAITLFGFGSAEERAMFLALIGVHSIGPAKALSIMSTPMERLVQLIAGREIGQLAKLPGIGKKTAERITLDLAERFTVAPGTGAPAKVSGGIEAELISGLTNLGYREAKAEELAKAAREALGPEAQLEELLRQALRPS